MSIAIPGLGLGFGLGLGKKLGLDSDSDSVKKVKPAHPYQIPYMGAGEGVRKVTKAPKIYSPGVPPPTDCVNRAKMENGPKLATV